MTQKSSQNILLAKVRNMYYPIAKKIVDFTCNKFPTLLIVAISVVTFQTNAHADKFQIAEKYRIKGFEEQAQGNFDGALQWYIKSASLTPGNAVVYNDIGVVYEQLGIFGKAEAYYLRALEVDSNYLPPYMNLAYLYLTMGDTAKAADYFEKRIMKADRDDPWAEKADQELQVLDPYRIERQRQLMKQEVDRLEQELLTEAREKFQQEIVRAEKHFDRGMGLVKQGEYDKAVSEFDRALLITPENPKVTRARALALNERVRSEVQQHSDEALKLLELGDANSAKDEFRKILTIIPNEPIQKFE